MNRCNLLRIADYVDARKAGTRQLPMNMYAFLYHYSYSTVTAPFPFPFVATIYKPSLLYLGFLTLAFSPPFPSFPTPPSFPFYPHSSYICL